MRLFTPFMLVPFMLIGITILTITYINKRRKEYKNEVVHQVLSELFDEFEYGFRKGLNRERVYNTHLVRSGNQFKSDDYLKGTYKGIDFEFSDVSIKHHVKQGKTSTTYTYFVGQWIIIKPHKKVSSELYVVDKNLRYAMANNANLFKENVPKVKLESIAFNKEFNVYAHNSHDAFYVLNPAFIEKLTSIHQDDVSFYMNESELHIALYSRRDLFEPPFLGKFDIDGDRKKIKKALDDVLKYIELFK